jgi:hypothetical protein
MIRQKMKGRDEFTDVLSPTFLVGSVLLSAVLLVLLLMLLKHGWNNYLTKLVPSVKKMDSLREAFFIYITFFLLTR